MANRQGGIANPAFHGGCGAPAEGCRAGTAAPNWPCKFLRGAALDRAPPGTQDRSSRDGSSYAAAGCTAYTAPGGFAVDEPARRDFRSSGAGAGCDPVPKRRCRLTAGAYAPRALRTPDAGRRRNRERRPPCSPCALRSAPSSWRSAAPAELAPPTPATRGSPPRRRSRCSPRAISAPRESTSTPSAARSPARHRRTQAERRAETVAKNVKGVQSVNNLLQVVPAKSEDVEAKDDQIEKRVDQALADDQHLKGSDIDVASVNNGVKSCCAARPRRDRHHLEALERRRQGSGRAAGRERDRGAGSRCGRGRRGHGVKNTARARRPTSVTRRSGAAHGVKNAANGVVDKTNGRVYRRPAPRWRRGITSATKTRLRRRTAECRHRDPLSTPTIWGVVTLTGSVPICRGAPWPRPRRRGR